MTAPCMSGGGRIAHGGRLEEARRLFPGAPAPFIDLSTGINPVPYAFEPVPAHAFTRLPEPAELWALQAAAARAYGVADPAMVVAAPGTQILISLLPRLFAQKAVAVLGPTYAEHAAAWAAGGAAVQKVTAFGDLAPFKAAVLCNPNNPDGRRYAADELLDLAERTRLLIVDEAFADLEEPGISLASEAARPGIIVLRSFGKSFGLAGLRLGFALAAPETASRIRDALGPWAVSGAALHIGLQALADTAWRLAAMTRLLDEARRLDAVLSRAGYRVAGGTRLFRLVESADAAGLFGRLGAAGIFVRRFENQRRWLRFGLPAPGEWTRVEHALAD